ncbi:hypothetical protein [Chondromyces crocatus]|uniref:Uncharacterized protein n=1 Tax=Chondromyces crocatus TaxID=52 RepID=A0A0K1EIJ4_CHOCO|nr:hypothetical protein [Chondromyces crocatus]AKT40507.1 uncharacterized protein CMC5_046620 [Chondromyces crocatus]
MSGTLRSRVGRWAFAVVPLVGVVELLGHVAFSRRAPRFEDWAAVRAPVEALKQEGDLVVVAPDWADPLARRVLGDGVMPLREAARPDESRYAGAIEISVLGQHVPALSSFREVAREQRGPFLVRRLENPAKAEVVFDFVDNLSPRRVDVFGTEPAVTCTWNPKARVLTGGLGGHPTFPLERFECPGGVFFNVGVTVIADQEFRPRRCIWSHPFARGEIVTRFRGVPLGKVIRGHAGMYWMIERERRGAPVTLAVRVNGEEIGRSTHHDGEGWASFELPLGAHAGAKEAEVEFAVSSPNHQHRHYCFEADTR